MEKTKLSSSLDNHSSTFYTSLVVVRYLLWGVFVFIGVIAASLNAEMVVFRYFWSTATLPLYLLLLLSGIIGWLMGISLNMITHIRLNAHNRRLQQYCREVEEEIIRLKRDFTPDSF